MAFTDIRPRTIRLDGDWEFAWLGDADLARAAEGFAPADVTYSERVAVPGCFDALPGLEGARGTAAFRTTFVQHAGHGLLHFDGAGIWAAIFVDGVLLHVHRKPYSPFSVRVPSNTDGATSAERELVVLVDNRFDTARSPLQENYFDFYAYGGIFRPVCYVDLPDAYLTAVRVTTVALEPPAIEVTAAATAAGTVTLTVDGRRVASQAIAAQDNGAQATIRVELPEAALWSPQSPALHDLVVELESGSTRDSWHTRFGIRTVATANGNILLNGSPIRLFGWNRHESHPQYGPALPHQQLVHDLRIMRAAGANFVRGSHYPQDERFLDLCDETGMLVWEESIGWQQDTRHFADAAYQQLIAEQHAEMIEAHANHASIIMWGFQNELHSERPEGRPVVERLASLTHRKDPSRLVTFASCRFPNDLCLDLVDVVSLNVYPGWYASDQEAYRPLAEIAERLDAIELELGNQGFGDKPLIVSEIGAGAIYGWRDPHAGHWSEQYQSDYLMEVCTNFLRRPRMNGLALWQFCDCRTYGSASALKRPRGFNNKGILDEYRRPKQAYHDVARLMNRDGQSSADR